MIVKGEEALNIFQIIGGAIRLYGVLISNRGSYVSFADDFNDLFIILFLLSGFKAQHSRFIICFFEPAVFYFTDSEVRQWQAIDTSLGATPKPPRKEAKAI